MEHMSTKFSRRGVIRGAAMIAGGATIAAGLGHGVASAQDVKVAQSAVQYQTTPKGKAQCSNCGSFIAPAACKMVSGTISPSGWCSIYNAKA